MITSACRRTYVETLLWSTSLPESIPGHPAGTPLDRVVDCDTWGYERLSGDAGEHLETFQGECLKLGIDVFTIFDGESVARCFALARNGCGSGFFDSTWQLTVQDPAGIRIEDLAQELQAIATAAGTHEYDVTSDEDGISVA